MNPESTTAQPQPISPATWGAVGTLVLLLAALSLIFLGCDRVFGLHRENVCAEGTVMTVEGSCKDRAPNYYACECECTQGFSNGARISPTATVNVRQTPAGAILGQAAPPVQGTIIEGPIDAVLAGVNETWWRVDFDSGVDGWVVQSLVTVLASDPLLTKDLQACLPPKYNANVTAFEHTPTPVEITADCSTERVGPAFAERMGPQLPPGSTCTCGAQTFPTQWVAECDAECTDASGVCLVAGTDPPEPTPDALSTALFTTTSVCEVSGDAEIHVADQVVNTSVSGVVHIHGRPCLPGQVCRVGISYQLKLADVSIPVRFASDPKFVDLTVAGSSEPLAVELAPLLGPLYVGNIPTGASLNSARGRRAGAPQTEAVVVVGRNGSPLGVAVDWVNKRCLLDGSFVGGTGGVVDDDGNTVDLQLYLTVGGQTDALSLMVNQPPRANAGPDQTLQCTSPAGAAVTLNAGGSTDADNNLAFYTWRRGTENGPHVAPPSSNPSLTTQQPIGETNYHLRVVDGRLSADGDSVKMRVVDTGAPTIDCQAPATIPKHDQPIAFRATASDTCGAPPAVVISNVQCFKVSPDGREKANPSCKASVQGDTLTIGNSAGADLIRWQTGTTDAVGNVGSKTCEVRVN